MKRTILIVGALLTTCVLSAQQSFGLQNHPVSQQLRESLDFQLLWDSRFQTIILILVAGILLTWAVYLSTVYQMFREKKTEEASYTASNVTPTSPEYDFIRATGSLRGQNAAPALSFVDHSPEAPAEGRDDGDESRPVRGTEE